MPVPVALTLTMTDIYTVEEQKTEKVPMEDWSYEYVKIHDTYDMSWEWFYTEGHRDGVLSVILRSPAPLSYPMNCGRLRLRMRKLKRRFP